LGEKPGDKKPGDRQDVHPLLRFRTDNIPGDGNRLTGNRLTDGKFTNNFGVEGKDGVSTIVVPHIYAARLVITPSVPENRVTKTVETVEFQFGRRLTFRSRVRPQYAICGISVTEV
jgi:hypothetical protein